ncbi:hypothetical protein ACP70R_013809 [Stipagrostis hirtigluma subsp. patula]
MAAKSGATAVAVVLLLSIICIALAAAVRADAAPTRPDDAAPLGPVQMSCMECLVRCCVTFGSPPEPCHAFCGDECAPHPAPSLSRLERTVSLGDDALHAGALSSTRILATVR